MRSCKDLPSYFSSSSGRAKSKSAFIFASSAAALFFASISYSNLPARPPRDPKPPPIAGNPLLPPPIEGKPDPPPPPIEGKSDAAALALIVAS